MFGFLKSRREKTERRAQLQELGRAMGESLDAELNLFLELQIVPARHAYIDVLDGQLASLDQRMKEMIDAGELQKGELGKEEAAALEVRMMMDNWDKRSDERLAAAHNSLSEELELAEEMGVADQYRAAIKEALLEQRMSLLTDGMAAINKFMGH